MYDKRMVYCSKEEASVYSQQHRYPVALIMNGLFHGVSMAYTRPNNACLSDRGFWGLHRPRQTN